MDDHQRDALRARHAALEAEIQEEARRPRPNEARLKQLKIDKLRIKEQLEGVAPALS